MRTILIALLIISIGVILKTMQLVAGETIMVRDAAINEKRIYKSKSSILGKKLVEQKVAGEWVNWCKKDCEKIEVYDSGAMQVQVITTSWPSIPKQGIIVGSEYYHEATIWIDFEFGTRKVQSKLFSDKSRLMENKKIDWRGTSTYKCEIQGEDG